jgi:hypothetical protein
MLPMRRPTQSSALDVPRRASIIRPYHHRLSVLATPHDPTPPPRVVDATAGASPPPKQELQRQAPPATAASRRRAPSRPVSGHKSSPGEPLFLPHSFPSRTRHQSRTISAGTAASMAKGLHCFSFVISRVFFVDRGLIRDRNKNSRDLPVKPSLK